MLNGKRDGLPGRVRMSGASHGSGRGRGREPPAAGQSGANSCARHDGVREWTLEITFVESGAEAYAFTFGVAETEES